MQSKTKKQLEKSRDNYIENGNYVMSNLCQHEINDLDG